MPVQFTQKKSFGQSGNADVTVRTKIVTIAFEDGEVYEIARDVWDGLSEDRPRPSGEYNVLMSKDGNKVISLKPTAGTYVVRFSKFAGGGQTGIPVPRIQRGGARQSSAGGTYMAPDKMVFDALLEVDSPGHRFDGLNILCILTYGFEQIPGTTFAGITMSGKRDLERIESFFRAAGFDLDLDIPFSNNVLPWLEGKLKEADRAFMVTTNEKGFIDTIAELPLSMQKAHPPRKAAKPKAKKK